MTRITLNADLADRLNELGRVVELCDPSGKVVGRFVPAADMSDWEPMIREASEEELRRREESDDWVGTDDVLARLRGLEQP